MKEVERTFLEGLKRFFEPVSWRPLLYLKYFIVSSVRGISGIVHILFLERITFYLQKSDSIGFNEILKYYIIFIISYEILNFSLKKWGWVETLPLGMADVYSKYLKKYIGLDNNKIETIGTGKLIGTVQSGTSKWLELIADCFEQGTALLVSFIFTIYMIIKVDLIYSFIFLLLFGIFLVISVYFNSKMIPYRKHRFELRNSRLKYIVKILMNKQEIMQSSKIDKESENIYGYSYQLRDANKAMGLNRTIVKRVAPLGMSLILFTTFWFLGNQVLDGSIGLNILVGLTGTLIIMQRAISEAISFYVQITKDYVDIEKMWDFFDITPKMKGYEKGKDFEYKKGKIELENIKYGYTKKNLVFDDFSLKLKGGKITALVGNSGSGKSTLVKLISGYIRADKGHIIIDGQKLNKVNLKSFYRNIGYLTQEPSVFDGSIIENLTYAIDRKLKDGELDEILKQAKCEFIYELPNGIETEIGERGIRLSGGQRQRLAIAKIFLKDPKIIILDEPTSALDSFSEEQITKAMHNLFENRTVIVIAHRLQTVKEANDIILFENGKIIERGNHKELVKLKGQYKKMLDLQSGF